MWKCFHCSFETDNYDEAAAHFGGGDGDPALCVFWASMDDAERAHAYQQMVLELNGTREELLAMREVQDDRDSWQQRARRLEDKLRELATNYGGERYAEAIVSEAIHGLRDVHASVG